MARDGAEGESGSGLARCTGRLESAYRQQYAGRAAVHGPPADPAGPHAARRTKRHRDVGGLAEEQGCCRQRRAGRDPKFQECGRLAGEVRGFAAQQGGEAAAGPFDRRAVGGAPQ